MEPVITILESFTKPLPRVASDNRNYYPMPLVATSSTANEDAMRVLLPKKLAILLNGAKEALQTTPSIPERLDRPMPQHEKSHYIHTESDVQRVSTLQLIHPVNVVLSGILLPGVTLRCQSEVVSQSGKARTDLKWVCRRGDEETTVAVLEYKNIKALRLADWSPAITNLVGAAATVAAGSQSDNSTVLTHNALKLSQQVNKYSKECKDIALFDWFSMYIFDLDGVDEDGADPVPTKITCSTNSSRFRSLLLGMIYNRLRKNELVKLQ